MTCKCFGAIIRLQKTQRETLEYNKYNLDKHVSIFDNTIYIQYSCAMHKNIFIKRILRSKHLTSRWQWNASYTSGIILMLWQVIKSTTTQTKTLAMFTSRFRSSLDCWWLSVSCRCIFLDLHILLNKMQQRYIPICIYVI